MHNTLENRSHQREPYSDSPLRKKVWKALASILASVCLIALRGLCLQPQPRIAVLAAQHPAEPLPSTQLLSANTVLLLSLVHGHTARSVADRAGRHLRSWLLDWCIFSTEHYTLAAIYGHGSCARRIGRLLA